MGSRHRHRGRAVARPRRQQHFACQRRRHVGREHLPVDGYRVVDQTRGLQRRLDVHAKDTGERRRIAQAQEDRAAHIRLVGDVGVVVWGSRAFVDDAPVVRAGRLDVDRRPVGVGRECR